MPILFPVSVAHRRISTQCPKALALPVAHRFDFSTVPPSRGSSRCMTPVISLFWHFLVLVLSNAVLVLVLSNAVLVLVLDAKSVLASDSGTPLIASMVE